MIERRADVCVAGCGPAGAIVAEALARAGRSVVVLEQGPRYARTDQERVTRHGGSINDGIDRRLDSQVTSSGGLGKYAYGRALGVGGSTLHWAGHAPRPTAEDLAPRTRFGYGRDWPLVWGELEPWLLAAERELGVAGADDSPYASPRSGAFPMPAHAPSWFDRELFAPACERLGFTAHSRPVAIASVATADRPACRACGTCGSCPSGARYSSDLTHVPRMLATGRAELLTGHRVRRFEMRGDRVDAAHATRVADGETVVVRAETYVCALGGVETPRMLLLSAGNDHAGGVGNAGGQLGRWFSDHRVLPFTMLVARPTGARLGFATTACDHYRVHLDRRTSGTFGLWIWPCWPDVEALVRRSVGDDHVDLVGLRRSLRSTAGGYATLELDGGGTLDLDPRTSDAFGDPVARVDFPTTTRDRETVARCRNAIRTFAGALEAEEIVGDYPHGDLGTFGSHPSGACAMAARPDEGVCDRSLRVFGTQNLYLSGSAVFPHQGAANPTLTIAALAMRLGAHLSGTAS